MMSNRGTANASRPGSVLPSKETPRRRANDSNGTASNVQPMRSIAASISAW